MTDVISCLAVYFHEHCCCCDRAPERALVWLKTVSAARCEHCSPVRMASTALSSTSTTSPAPPCTTSSAHKLLTVVRASIAAPGTKQASLASQSRYRSTPQQAVPASCSITSKGSTWKVHCQDPALSAQYQEQHYVCRKFHRFCFVKDTAR